MSAAILDQPWRDRAACAGADAGLFFGPEQESAGAREAREVQAKRICARCPADVRRECLAFGESPLGHRYAGVYGGFGVKDRQALRRRSGQERRQAAERGTP